MESSPEILKSHKATTQPVENGSSTVNTSSPVAKEQNLPTQIPEFSTHKKQLSSKRLVVSPVDVMEHAALNYSNRGFSILKR